MDVGAMRVRVMKTECRDRKKLRKIQRAVTIIGNNVDENKE